MLDTSIIIPSYNNGKYLGRCIRSCLKQSIDRHRYEIIVVDDCSTDESKKVIESFGNQVEAIYLKKNLGVAGASNVGIQRAIGTFIYRLDSDDYINENTLLFLTEILSENKDIGFVYADHIRVDENENQLERVNLDTIDKLFSHGAGIMFRKSYLEKIGLYNADFRHADDYELLTRYFKNFDGYHLKLPLYRYRQHKGNITKLGKRQEYVKKANNHSGNRH